MRVVFVALVVAVLAGCGGPTPPRSDYFLVSFDPASADLASAGRAVLENAVSAAQRGSPRAVVVKGYVSSNGNERALSERRMQVVADALVQAGVPRGIVEVSPQLTDPANFIRLANGVFVQIERGEPVVPRPIPGAE